MARPPLAVEQQRQPGVMMIRGLLTAGAVAAGVFSSVAQAGVVYNWAQIGTAPFVGSTAGRLEIDSDAWVAGTVDYAIFGANVTGDSTRIRITSNGPVTLCPYGTGSPIPNCTDPAAPIVSFGLGVTSPNGQSSGAGAAPQGNVGPYTSAAFLLTLGTDLAGRINAYDGLGDNELRLTGANGIWTAQFVSGNAGMPGCSISPGCAFTGRWVLDATTMPGFVPEPGILPLLALGAFGVAASMRRRRG